MIETLGLGGLEGPARAVATVGLVLVEAAMLYVGYGVVANLLGPTLHEMLGGD